MPEISFLSGRPHLFSDWLMDPSRSNSGTPEEIYIVPDGELTAAVLAEIAEESRGREGSAPSPFSEDVLPDENFPAYACRVLAAKTASTYGRAAAAKTSGQAFLQNNDTYKLALGLIYLNFFAGKAAGKYAEKLENTLGREIFECVCGVAEPYLTRDAVLLAKAYCRFWSERNCQPRAELQS